MRRQNMYIDTTRQGNKNRALLKILYNRYEHCTSSKNKLPSIQYLIATIQIISRHLHPITNRLKCHNSTENP